MGVGVLLLVKVPVNSGLKVLLVVQLAALVELSSGGSLGSTATRSARILSAGLLASFGLLALTTLERPFLPIFLLSAVVTGLWAWSRHFGTRALWVNAAALTATLAVAEAVWGGVFARLVGSPGREDVVVTERATGQRLAGGVLMAPDSVRGFAGPAGCTVRVTRSSGRQVESDVTYTIGASGLRETGSPRPVASARRVLFLGDSFAFGEGVQDAEAAPAQLERFLPDTVTVNLAFKGYGPHQALATLENQLESRASPGPYSAAVYYAYLDLSRAAGRAPWDAAGPRYTLSGDGGVAFAGPFSASVRLRSVALLNRSFIFSRAIPRFFNSERDVELFARILLRSAEIFRSRHQGTFLCLLWGESSDSWYARAVDVLRARGLEVHTVQQVLPEAERQGGRWTLPDGHPNAAAQARVAEYLAGLLKTP